MDLSTITNIITNNIKKGQITKVHYQTISKTGYKKETKTLVRFVQYGHIAGVQVAGKKNPNENDIIDNILIYNTNTQQYYLQMAVIDTGHKAQTTYFNPNGQEITKAEYETANPKKTYSNITSVFRKNIKDIISLG